MARRRKRDLGSSGEEHRKFSKGYGVDFSIAKLDFERGLGKVNCGQSLHELQWAAQIAGKLQCHAAAAGRRSRDLSYTKVAGMGRALQKMRIKFMGTCVR